MDSNGTHAKDSKRSDDSDAKSKDNSPTAANTPTDANKSPRKRRKVNHACVYCRRSHMTCDLERPCTRCIKRNIGHLCHDEPRDPDAKKTKELDHAPARDQSDNQVHLSRTSIDRGASTMEPASFKPAGPSQGRKPGFGPLGQRNHLQLVPPNTVSDLQTGTLGSNPNQLAGFSDAWLTAQTQFHDMHHYNPQYMLPQEVSREFNLLNDFLNTSLLDESGNITDEQEPLYRTNQSSPQADMAGFIGGGPLPPSAMEAGSMPPPYAERTSIVQRQKGTAPPDKTREFYLQAADPSGNATPEARMTEVLKAKYAAGLLKPFNYVNGYKRLSNYMDGHLAPASKHKILRQLDRFRPKFREKVQALTDMQLIYVEMWFEKSLLEYDRVFASMAVPACCWRRSGEIFRGNKEMAELIHVPVEKLRDGKISLHEIMTEESLVRYWEEFGTIAFDPAHETLFTACALKNPDDHSNDPVVNCCFSFMIRRDEHKISLRERKLTDISASDLQTVTDELENQINALKTSNVQSISSLNHGELHSAGVALWNWSTKGKRRHGEDLSPSKNRLFVLVRVLSFSMLSLALRSNQASRRSLVQARVILSSHCKASNELVFALWVLQKAVEYNGRLQDVKDSPAEAESPTCSQFEAECTTLRIVLAWKEGRMDVAEHLYERAKNLMSKADTTTIEKLSDALFEIGRDLAQKSNSGLAVKWLERAYELLNSQDLAKLSRDALEMRLAISQALIQVYLDMGSPDGFDRAENHIAYVESELGDKLVVLLFRLELLHRAPAELFDGEAYGGILRRIMKVVDMSDHTFKLLIHHIRLLEEKNSAIACSVLDESLLTYILPHGRDQWVEKAVVLRTHMAIREGSLGSIKGVETVLDQLLLSRGKPLPVNIAAGMQALIWKRADAEFGQGKFESAASWCQLGLHSSLEQSGPSNRGKLSRKLLLCAIQQNDFTTAADILGTMDQVTLNEPMTAYLAFQVALRQGDTDCALTCLEKVSTSPSSDPQYLYACCIEAQISEDKICAIEALRHLVLKRCSDSHSLGDIHLPALLRVLIRLEVSVLSDEKRVNADHGSLVEDLCNVFKTVVSVMQKERRDAKAERLFTVEELNWFCKNSYNLGLENATVWEARHVVCILDCCLSMIACYPADVPAQTRADCSLRGMFCHFIAAMVLLALARSEDRAEQQLQDYVNMRRHIQRFHETLDLQSEDFCEASREDLQSKMSTLLVFEFEAATCLKSWDDLKSIILKAQQGGNLLIYQAMGDCILRCPAVPVQVLHQTMRELVTQIYALEQFDIHVLAKYLRCLLKATLPTDHKISLDLIKEIGIMVKHGANAKRQYPQHELEWAAITAFNHGLDLFHNDQEELSNAWISQALTLAHLLQDAGQLERQLQDNLSKWNRAGGSVQG
ncbi:meiosis protein SPO22/ZIP4 like-domain-containing protein [Xylariaceae sp. FL0594]|nr:meiosis protein SPO22/ZIP4 like-domain-containing protein [Xylariaceae sp. FL0594]